jgi:hypothetical protein
MRRFKGKNSISSTIVLAVNRSKYDIDAFPENGGLGPKQVVNFNFAERVMYGRTDPDLDVVVPSQEFLKAITTQENQSPVVMMNFVADAFLDFERSFEYARNAGKIRGNDPFLSNVKVFKAYEDPENLYLEYLDSLFDKFNKIFLKPEKAMDIKGYADQFLLYIKQMSPQFPITYTAWNRSKESNLFTSGLAISLSGLAIDNDEGKDAFILRDNFEFYKNACINYGFSIVKNSPWVIVADLGNPRMLEYMARYTLSDARDVFSLQFNKTAESDIRLLKTNILNNYNFFVQTYLYEKEISICPTGKLNVQNNFRSISNQQEMNEKLKNNYWIEFYNNARFYEEGMRFSVADKNKFSRNAKNLEKVFDIQRAIGYINEQYRSIYKSKRGGINDLIKRKNEKDK